MKTINSPKTRPVAHGQPQNNAKHKPIAGRNHAGPAQDRRKAAVKVARHADPAPTASSNRVEVPAMSEVKPADGTTGTGLGANLCYYQGLDTSGVRTIMGVSRPTTSISRLSRCITP